MYKALLSVSAVGLVVAVGFSPANAATIKGKVSNCKGCTVVAVAKKGSGASAKLKANGSFRLQLKGKGAKGAQLQIIKKRGNYLGPIVLKHKNKRAYVTLRGTSVNLGKIKVKKGYAVVAKSMPKRAVSGKWAKANEAGKPTGAGKLGMSKRKKGKGKGKKKKARIAKTKGPATSSGDLDTDRDGIAKGFDVDGDADGVLDSVEGVQRSPVNMFSNLKVPIEASLNLNATGVDQARVNALIKDQLSLVYEIPFDQQEAKGATSVNVDCLGLTYCRAGNGTATIDGVGGTVPGDLPMNSLWTSYDTDSDGLPNLYRSTELQRFAIIVRPKATTSEVNPGDSYNVIATSSSGKTSIASNLDFYFYTTPAVTTYDVGAGPQTVSYPIAAGTTGTQGNPVQMASNSITLTFWRPQRPALPGESGSFFDIGLLLYGVEPVEKQDPGGAPGPPPAGEPPAPGPPAAPGPGALAGGVHGCKAQYYSNLSPTLKTGGDEAASTPLEDTANDAPPNAANTLSFTLDLGGCLSSQGVATAGQTFDLDLQARGERGDNAAQKLTVKMPG